MTDEDYGLHGLALCAVWGASHAAAHSNILPEGDACKMNAKALPGSVYNDVMRRGRGWLLGLLLCLLLSGCPGCIDKKELVIMGMLNAPLSYLCAIAVLAAVRYSWSWREPDTRLRLAVLGIPFGFLLGVALQALSALSGSEKMKIDVLTTALRFSIFIVPIIWGALCVPQLIFWRIFFAISPKGSFEWAAIVGTAVFFAPGLAGLFGLVPLSTDFVGTLILICIFSFGGLAPLIVLLGLESTLTKRKTSSGKLGQPSD